MVWIKGDEISKNIKHLKETTSGAQNKYKYENSVIFVHTYLWGADTLGQYPNSEDTESVNDKLAWRDAVDVEGFEVSLQQPLGVLDVDVGTRVVATLEERNLREQITIL